MISTRRLVAAATLAVAALASPANTPLAPAPAGATTATLTLEGTVNHTLTSWSTGVGPREAFSSPALADVKGVGIDTHCPTVIPLGPQGTPVGLGITWDNPALAKYFARYSGRRSAAESC